MNRLKYSTLRILFVVFLLSILYCSCYTSKIKNTEVVKLLETTTSWNGEPLPAYPKGSPKVSILKIRIPAKTKLAMHKHPIINAGVLLKGELTVITENNDTLQLAAGDALSEVVDTWHYGINKCRK